MINNELLAKMLDGTLSESERSLLQSEAVSHPEIADEIAQLQRIEKMLVTSGNRYDIPTPSFLKSVEDEIAQKVRDSRSIKPVPILPPNFDTKFNWNLLIMTCSGLVTIGSLGYLGYTKYYTPAPIVRVEQTLETATTPSNLQTTVETSQSTYPISREQVSRKNQTSVKNAVQLSQSEVKPESKPEQTATSTDNAKDFSKPEVSGSIDPQYNDNSSRNQIQSMIGQLEEKQRMKDKFAEMTLNKRIGLLYSQSGNGSDAKKYLENALLLAHNTNTREEEGILLGEIGLVESKLGNSELAASKIRQAIDILTSLGINTEKWTKALSVIHKK
jgi:hypothetical protein